MSDDEVDLLTDEDDRREDEELMQNLIVGIETLKKEKPSTPTGSPQPVQPEAEPEAFQSGKNDDAQTQKNIDLDSLSIDELRVLLDEVNEARALNSQLQGMLLMKEVKLLSLKRQIAFVKSRPRNRQKDEQKIDAGRYYVQFKAPYFKNAENFAGYVIVPENQLPVTAQRYETPAGQWNKNALKDLEANVRTFLTAEKFREMMKNKPKTLREKENIISTYTYLRKHAPMSSLIGDNFSLVIDWCSVASKLKKDFSPNECEKAWNIFLSPHINKKKWTVAEKESLKRVALEHNYQDWDAIAEELGTHRNGYQCFHLYADKIMKLVEGDWSKAEEDFLTQLVKKCTYGNKVMWHKMAYYFETRTVTQIYRKWTLSCVGKEVVAGAFTEDEDKTIMQMLIVQKGEFSIAQVAKKLNRISSQIRYRFSQLKSSLMHKYGEWSLEEDKLLLDLVEKFGKKSWSKIAEHMPNRGRVQIRHRYTNLKKRLAKNPQLSLETLCRFKRPVHAKRKEMNLKCLMQLTGIEEQPAEVTTVQAVGQILGPDRKKRRKEPLQPMAPLSPGRYPDVDEDGLQLDDEDIDVPDIPLSPDVQDFPDQDPLKQSPVKAKPGGQPVKTEPRASSDSEDEPEQLKGRSPDLYGPIVDHYNMMSDFTGDIVKPPQNQCLRRRSKAETLNSVLKFLPYKYFHPDNVEWTFNADRTDPYFSELFRIVENQTVNEGAEEDQVHDDLLLPPCLTNFQGFYNLLVDMGMTEEDLETADDKLEAEMKKLYCNDAETNAAVSRWHKRLSTLFAWPAALSEITLEIESPNTANPEHAHPEDDNQNAGEDAVPSTSKGRRKSMPKRTSVIKTEPIDDECARLTNLGLVD